MRLCEHEWLQFDHWFNGDETLMERCLVCRQFRGSILVDDRIHDLIADSPEMVFQGLVGSNEVRARLRRFPSVHLPLPPAAI
ncbi:MAG: hypothetical protein WBX15_20885 [Thermoanaerobaculia bacterium]